MAQNEFAVSLLVELRRRLCLEELPLKLGGALFRVAASLAFSKTRPPTVETEALPLPLPPRARRLLRAPCEPQLLYPYNRFEPERVRAFSPNGQHLNVSDQRRQNTLHFL